MKLGICARLDEIDLIRDLGFDYLESYANAMSQMSEADFAVARRRVADSGLPVSAMCGIFPWGSEGPRFHLFESGSPESFYRDWFRRTFGREAELGVRFSVFGNGGYRRFPATVSYGDACKRLAEVLRWAGEEAAPCGVTVVFEPLNSWETNLGNSLCEGFWLVREADHPNVALLADYYHMARMGEPMSEVTRVGGIRHAHLATREGRHSPVVASNDSIGEFLERLLRLGTCETVSIEAHDSPSLQGSRGLETLRRLLAEAEERIASNPSR